MCAITGKVYFYRFLLYGLACCVGLGLHAESISVSSRKKDEKALFSVELFVPKKPYHQQTTYVVGQMIPFTIRCTYDPQGYGVSMIALPTNAEIVVATLSEVKSGQTQVNGISCVTHEWHGMAYAKKSGTHEFGPFQIGGEQRATHTSQSLFRMMWNSSFTGYSNTVMMACSDLPPCSLLDKKKDDFFPVGDFYSAQIEFERFTMKTGEAQTIKYIIEGSGNGLLLDHPALDLPAGLKYYAAQKKQESATRFIFEYVIQATEQGIMTIPAQEFFYFDTTISEYRALKTAPVRLHVGQGAALPKTEQEIFESEKSEYELSSELSHKSEEVSPEAVSKSSFLQTLEIPKELFFILFFALCAGILYLCTSAYLFYVHAGIKKRIRYYRAVRQIRVGYKKFQCDGDVSLLYEKFKELSIYYQDNNASRDEWHSFWNRLECIRFGREFHNDERRKFIDDTQQWIIYFEKKIWQKN